MSAGRVIASVLLLGAGILIGFGYGRWYGPRPAPEAAKIAGAAKGYHCPMHPGFRSDKPGNCGICGMRLVPDQEGANTAAGAREEAEESRNLPPGTIRVSPARQQLIGVTYAEAQAAAGIHTFRASGKVVLDETRVVKVQTRVEGWIDKVYADFIGKAVQQGQPLLTLYSPELLASQQEFLLAMRSREIMKSSPLAGSFEQSESLVAAARKRLELWDLSESQIAELARTQKPLTYVTVSAPITGYVIARNAFPKQRVTPETELYTVADLSKVWVMADVFEDEAARIGPGMAVRISLPYAGGRALAGRVNYVQPQVDASTRTLKVRIELDNPDMLLKPEMFVNVEFRIETPPRLSVPAEAVLDSGLKKTVFVDRGNGYLEPRHVETGERIGDRVEIVRGLKAGERVVVSGNFLIDSESQLKAAAAGMTGHQHDARPVKPPEAPAGGHQHD